MGTKENGNEIAVKYLGKSLLAVIIVIIICFLATIGYNTYISVSQEKNEVNASNINSNTIKQWRKKGFGSFSFFIILTIISSSVNIFFITFVLQWIIF